MNAVGEKEARVESSRVNPWTNQAHKILKKIWIIQHVTLLMDLVFNTGDVYTIRENCIIVVFKCMLFLDRVAANLIRLLGSTEDKWCCKKSSVNN